MAVENNYETGSTNGHSLVQTILRFTPTRGSVDRFAFGSTEQMICMGFGSYDESEQQDRDVSIDDDGESVHENDYEGTISFEMDESADDLVGRLSQMKGDAESE